MPICGGSVTVVVGSGNRKGAEPGKTVLRGIAEDGSVSKVSVFLAGGFRRISRPAQNDREVWSSWLTHPQVRFFDQLWVTPRTI